MRGDVVQGISNTKNLQLSPDTTIPCSNDINVIPTSSPSTSSSTSLLSPDMLDNPFQYPTLHRLLQGIRTYLNDTRYAMHYGYYMDKNNMPYFFSELENPEELVQLCSPLIDRCRELINKFVKYDIREVDIASLAYIIFSLECEKLSLHTDVIENQKNIVFGEMHANYVKNFGYEQGGVKFANVLCLLHDIMDLTNHIVESLAIGKIFVPEFLDVWDEMS
uniref:NR LBD domain-containing protein n=1 Tax=Acrobeloides nanus TaxID=290746 RepID=A0A914DU76_9BILA